MKTFFFLILLSILTISCKRNIAGESFISEGELIHNIVEQGNYALQETKKLNQSESRVFPRALDDEGNIARVGKKDWTSGFYPGILWLLYDLTKDELWATEAKIFTEKLESEKYNASNHDIGFKMMSSYGQGFRLTGNKAYREVLIQSARTLLTRFNEKVGCIRSWDHHRDKWDYPVIIDNMINLELLFWASRETGDPVFSNIAVKHAQTTMNNHFRPDFSSYHVVSYDTITGKPVKKQTRQGASDESSWARGQAWALYGYTMVYRETKSPEFLTQAESIADYIFNIAKLPDDYIPYWDFSVSGNINEPRDVSSAAVIASALYELSSLTNGNSETYLQLANRIMDSLGSTEYFNDIGSHGGFLLRHSTGSKPVGKEIDVPLVYADYYFLEALLRKKQIQTNYILTAN